MLAKAQQGEHALLAEIEEKGWASDLLLQPDTPWPEMNRLQHLQTSSKRSKVSKVDTAK